MIKTLRNTAAALALTAVCGAANAVPALQLGIVGGTYDAATQTIISSGPTFTLYAFMDGLSTTDTYALSMALSPMTSTASTLGSFTVNGSTVNVTSGMTYGVPPIEAIAAQLADPGDLATHGVYPTYFKEEQFNTWSSNRASFCSGGNNTQDCPALTGLTFGSTGLYYKAFTIDVSSLAAGYAIHFDLYSLTICGNDQGQCASASDIDVNKFAPFSHDAQSSSRITSSATPAGASSSSLVGLGLGLLGFGFMRRRKQGV